MYSRHLGQSVEKIEEDIRRPKYFSPDEAVEYGIIDKVIIPVIFHGVCICELFCWRNYFARHKTKLSLYSACVSGC